MLSIGLCKVIILFITLKNHLARVAVASAHLGDMLLLLRRQPFLTVAILVIDTVAMQVFRHLAS